MKQIILSLTLLTSFIAFADTDYQQGFKDGFSSGRNSCQGSGKNKWRCKANISGTSKVNNMTRTITLTAIGPGRDGAMENLYKSCVGKPKELFRNGAYNCTNDLNRYIDTRRTDLLICTEL
jgi:hypothetical protein